MVVGCVNKKGKKSFIRFFYKKVERSQGGKGEGERGTKKKCSLIFTRPCAAAPALAAVLAAY